MAKKLWIENIDNPSALYQEATPDGDFLDKTNDAKAWYDSGEAVMDFWFTIGKIRDIVIPKCNPNYPTIDFSGWNNLSQDEKEIACRLIYAPYALRVPTIFTEEQDIENAINLLEKTYGRKKEKLRGRLKLVESMRQHVFLNYVRKGLLSLNTSKQFGVDTHTYLGEFERFANGNFYNWLTNAVGTSFENDGFAQKSYYSSQLKNELLAIYNGE